MQPFDEMHTRRHLGTLLFTVAAASAWNTLSSVIKACDQSNLKTCLLYTGIILEEPTKAILISYRIRDNEYS